MHTLDKTMKSDRIHDHDKINYQQNLPTESENNLTKGKADSKRKNSAIQHATNLAVRKA